MRGRVAAPALLVALAALAGCGKRGAPRPPEPKGPLPPRAVEARQVGGRIVVDFEMPRLRGEAAGQQPEAAELYRVSYAPGITPQVDPDAFRRRGARVAEASTEGLAPGNGVQVVDSLLVELPTAGVGHTLRYGVLLRDRRGRVSPLVVAPDVVPLETSGPPQAVGAEVTRGGVRLTWAASAPGTRYNVYRRGEGEGPARRPVNPEPIEGGEFLDSAIETGRRYVYVVRSLLAPDRPFRESAGSEPLEVVVADRFPPAPPAGLVAVQEGEGVRLFWNPGRDRDLAGYRLYRRESAADEEGAWVAIGPGAVDQPTWFDRDVRIGSRLGYRVTAIDGAEPPNESGPSDAVEIELIAEPATGDLETP